MIGLQKSTPSILYPKNDTVAIKQEEKADTSKKDAKPGSDQKKADSNAVVIDFDGMEQRMELLPVTNGNIGTLNVVKGKVLYERYQNTGAADGQPSLKFYDIEKREEKTILDGAENYIVSANREKILVFKAGTAAIINPTKARNSINLFTSMKCK